MKSPNSAGRLEFASPEIKVGLDAAKAASKPVMAPSKPAKAAMKPSMPKGQKMIISAPSPKTKRLPKRK